MGLASKIKKANNNSGAAAAAPQQPGMVSIPFNAAPVGAAPPPATGGSTTILMGQPDPFADPFAYGPRVGVPGQQQQYQQQGQYGTMPPPNRSATVSTPGYGSGYGDSGNIQRAATLPSHPMDAPPAYQNGAPFDPFDKNILKQNQPPQQQQYYDQAGPSNSYQQYQPPQQQYQQYPQQPPVQSFSPPPQPPPPGASASPQVMAQQADVISRHLQRIIQENGIQMFYPQQQFEQVVRRVSSVNFENVSSFWNVPKEISYDLSSVSLYDVVFFCDDSGSMRIEERGERIDDLKLILERIAEIAFQMDDDGVSVRFMNSTVSGDNVRSGAEVSALVDRVNFNGLTPLGTQLQRKVLDPFVLQPARQRQLRKPVFVIVITDGEPVGEDRGMLKRVIVDAKAQLTAMGYPQGTVAFTIAQCGKDKQAQNFLAELDNDPVIGSMIDCVSYYELESEEYARRGVDLTPELFLVKLCVGGIDKSYDEADE
ncbi:hypothetical protein HDU97_006887 [Phlyctochytrium planicorne]|nr:hypothetical protein HDU97_006887 [Phlyctochytrium planicorne]